MKPIFVDRVISYWAPIWGMRRQRARRITELASSYRAADTSRIRDNWLLISGEEATPGTWDLQMIRERARDANRNEPVAAGATDTLKHNVIGTGLKPQSRLRSRYLGIEDDRAKELQRQAENIWQKWTPQADAANVLDFDEIQFLALAKIIEDGEAIVIPTWAGEDWRHYGRCLELVESERLNDPGGKYEHGIKFGSRGEPLIYHVKSGENVKKINAKDSEGRPKILHIFPMKRPGQRRGIPYFAPILSHIKDLGDYLEATIISARVAACLAVFITKQDPINYAVNMAGSTEDSGDRVQTLEPGLISYLNSGESITAVEPKTPGDTFDGFVKSMLRMIGVAIGMPYELIAKDFSETNYSSARASLLEGRRMFINWRNWFTRKFCQPVYELVLEEAYLRGEFDVRDFYEYKNEYCRAQWLGGSWGWVDPVKEVEASKMAVDYGMSTLADETAGQGKDWEEILEQRAREKEKAGELGLEIGNADDQLQQQNRRNAIINHAIGQNE